MFLKKYHDLTISTCYRDPTLYKETTPNYLKPSKISWWDKLKIVNPEKKNPEVINMKACKGFIDFYRRAISLPSPFEIKIKYTEEEDKIDYVPNFSLHGPLEYQNFNKDSQTPVVQTHDVQQWGDAFPTMRQIKLSYPWHLQGPKGHQFLLTSNFWQTKKNIQILNGVLDFYYMHQMHIQFFMEAREQELIFEFGESPAVLLPLNNKAKYKIHYNYVPVEEWNALQSSIMYPLSQRHLFNKYQKYKNIKDSLTKIK
tara:strand:+ start:1227 stop:1994 length:768 start_codon:yes stop_codon:yes gene_type:complete